MAKQYTPKENNARAAAALTSDPMAVVPPQAVELEEAVLGALMLEKDAVIEVQGLITPEAFYNEAHQIIYKAIVDLSMELKPIDLYTVTEKLKQIKKLTAVGGPSYLAQLTQKVGSAAHVEFHAKIIAQLGVPDMRIPIQYALTYPARVPGVVPELDFTTLKLLTFDVADEETFRCLAACKKAIRKGGLGPCAANGANEEAVRLFLEDKIGFLDIGRLVEAVVDSDSFGGDYSLADVYECDRMARAFVRAHL